MNLENLEYDELIVIKRAVKCALLHGIKDEPMERVAKKIKEVLKNV